jgi:Flp pilus assembly protein TadB
MSSSTGFIFSYVLGLIFLVGGILFMIVLTQHRFLFGIPYALLGIVILVGLHMGRRRKKRDERHQAELLDSDDAPLV